MGDSGTFGSDSGVESTITLLETRLPATQERRRELEEELAAVTAQIDAMTGVLDGLRALAGTPLDNRDASAAPAQLPTSEEAVEVQESGVGQSGAAEAEAQPVPAVTRPARRTSAKKKPATTTARKTTARKTTARKTVAARNTGPASTDIAAQMEQQTAATKKTATKSVAKKTTKGAPPKETVKKVSAAGKRAAADVSAAPSPGRRRSVADADSVLAVLAKMAGPLRAREVTEELGLEAIAANVNAIRTQLERLASSGRAQRTGRGLYTTATEQSTTSG
ncbi:hypothetical protein ASE03_30715 [Kitasatospora sp. Root187]|nr:hypothetical protein ASE03_30715 [Kitasatospora sp. Root187]